MANQVSRYLEYLPTVFQENADQDGVSFIGQFLLAFEHILSGLGDPSQLGLEEKIDNLHSYFDPQQTPEDFLPWLANWVAVSLRDDWSEEEKRRFLGRIVPLYQKRGTRAGLQDLLNTYTNLPVQIEEPMGEADPPFYFIVRIALNTLDPAFLMVKEQVARAIIDQEKPAHTYYTLALDTPTMQISIHSTIGVDTMLGTHFL